MKYIQLPIMKESKATLTLYLHEVHSEIKIVKRPMILVIPGGGYGMVSEREAEPVASAYYHQGYHAAILRYSIGDSARNLQPMIEGMNAIKIIRESAEEWNIIENQVIVAGFSAGGHLACSLGVMWKEPLLRKALNYEDQRYQPNGMILSYPVITSGRFAHRNSFYHLSGSSENDQINEFYSLEKRVDESTPPTFIWHTRNDNVVPVENTLLFVEALQKNDIPYEIHIFREGSHGLSICNKETDCISTHCANWLKLSMEWINETFAKHS